MNALPEIAEWSKSLPDWQSDLARRAIVKGTLAASDVEDLTAMLLASVGVPDAAGRVPVRLSEQMIPARVTSADAVALKSIKNPVQVNALDDSAHLEFGIGGMTVIWGQNGAGKSGFSRILKRACRSRDQEPILPNVFSDARAERANAKIELVLGSETIEKNWIDDEAKDDSLSKVAIFDGRCARLFIDDQQEINVAVYGVDVLREMASGCQEIRGKLDEELEKAEVNFAAFDALRGGTSVGSYISSLSANSKKQVAQTLAKLTDPESAELKSLGEQLADDPSKKATAVRRLAMRFRELEAELRTVEGKLSDAKILEFKEAMAAYDAADKASQIASKELSEEGAAIPGTGTDPWRELMDSAMKFAKEAYPHSVFPSDDSDAQCVLCQQKLNPESRKRLKRFVQFIRADVQQKRDSLREKTGRLYKVLSEAEVLRIPSDKTIMEESVELSPSVKDLSQTYLKSIEARRVKIVTEAPQHVVSVPEPLPQAPYEALSEIREALEKRALAFDKASRAEERKELVKRFDELSARAKFAEILPAVLKAIDSLALRQKLETATKQTNTSVITRKSSELTEAAIAHGLNSSLDAELKRFKVAGLKLELGLWGERGKSMQQLKLDVRKPLGKSKISNVLSEGEQRAISIACFLAEVNLVSKKTAVVFDDPVSSVDNYRREIIAGRFGEEALHRQVVVFTHDLSFAWDLTVAAEKVGAACKTCCVYSGGAKKGLVANGLPHEGGKFTARMADLDQVAAKARRALEVDRNPATYELLVRDGYRKLRDAWERLIEEFLFGDAVRRFRNSVETKRLRYAEVSDDDFSDVEKGMTKCSAYTHDAPVEAPPPIPEPGDFEGDIAHIRSTHSRIAARMKITEKRRGRS